MLNRPEQLNAFSDELHDEFARVWADLVDDPGARAVVLTGDGEVVERNREGRGAG